MWNEPTFLDGRDFGILGVLGYGRTSLKILSSSRTRCSSTARSARRRLARSSACKYHKFYSIESNIKEWEVNHTSSTSIDGNITSSSFLVYSLLISNANSTVPGFSKSGWISAMSVTEMSVALLFWIAYNFKKPETS